MNAAIQPFVRTKQVNLDRGLGLLPNKLKYEWNMNPRQSEPKSSLLIIGAMLPITFQYRHQNHHLLAVDLHLCVQRRNCSCYFNSFTLFVSYFECSVSFITKYKSCSNQVVTISLCHLFFILRFGVKNDSSIMTTLGRF